MIDKDMKRLELYMKRALGSAALSLKARPKQKDSAEVYIGEEFVGVLFQDEDEEGSYMFEMAILKEDLDA